MKARSADSSADSSTARAQEKSGAVDEQLRAPMSSGSTAQSKPDAVEQWPERSSSCWSQLTFSYVTPLLKRGAQKTLDPEDL